MAWHKQVPIFKGDWTLTGGCKQAILYRGKDGFCKMEEVVEFHEYSNFKTGNVGREYTNLSNKVVIKIWTKYKFIGGKMMYPHYISYIAEDGTSKVLRFLRDTLFFDGIIREKGKPAKVQVSFDLIISEKKDGVFKHKKEVFFFELY